MVKIIIQVEGNSGEVQSRLQHTTDTAKHGERDILVKSVFKVSTWPIPIDNNLEAVLWTYQVAKTATQNLW